jgi:hypothetical protein
MEMNKMKEDRIVLMRFRRTLQIQKSPSTSQFGCIYWLQN